MAYFLKKTRNKKGLYLQIYESFRDPVRKETVHRSVKPLGYVDDLIQKGIADPLSYYGDEVKRMNLERKAKMTGETPKQISGASPVRYLGYFPIKSINNALGVQADLARLHLPEVLSSLVFAQVLRLGGEPETMEETLSRLFEQVSCSPKELADSLALLGASYDRILGIYSHHLNEKCPLHTDRTRLYMTCFHDEVIGVHLSEDGIPYEMQFFVRERYDVPEEPAGKELFCLEQSFQRIKEDLEAHPALSKNPDLVHGAFLVGYLSALLLQLFQSRILQGKYSREEVLDFITGFQVIPAEHRWINLSKSTPLLRELEQKFSLPLSHYYLTDADIRDMLSFPIWYNDVRIGDV